MSGRIYLAASFNARPQMRDLRDQLVAKGYTVTSRWLDVELSNDDPTKLAEQACWCLNDIGHSDLVAIFTAPESTAGGLHVEHGVAISQCKDRVLVGPIVNLFDAFTADDYPVFPDAESWLASLPDRSTPLALVEESYR